MIRQTAHLSTRIDFPSRVRDFLEQSERSIELWSPRKVEFKFCALTAAWDAIETRNSDASHWLEIWQKECRLRHRGKSGRSLSDPVKTPLSERWRIPSSETAKAYLTVRSGMRRVFNEIARSSGTAEFLVAATDPPAILFRQIQASFMKGKSFASPEGLEMFLLALTELFEESCGTAGVNLSTRKLWHAEIRRRRLGGPPETRTLADVAPVNVRLRRENAFPEEERKRVCNQMLSTMRGIVHQLTPILSEHSGRQVVH